MNCDGYGSYAWETRLSLVDALRQWKNHKVFPETHKRLKREGLCDNYRLTDAGRALIAAQQEGQG